jgi:hypothetical protein
MRQKTRWVVLGIIVAILIVGGGLLWSGKLGIDISQYFAYEPAGYVPPDCGWHGDQITAKYPYCCAEMSQVPVTWEGPKPTFPPDPGPIDRSLPVDADIIEIGPVAGELIPYIFSDYCVVPGCKAVAKVVECVQAPCEPIVEMVCPPGTVIPPRPTAQPGPISYNVVLNGGNPVVVGDTVTVAWRTRNPAGMPDYRVSLILHKRGWGPNSYTVAEDIENSGRYLWNTSQPVRNESDGVPQNLIEMTGDDLYLYLQDPDGTIVGTVSSFQLLPFLTPTPPTGAYRGVMIGVGNPSRGGTIPPGSAQSFALTVGRGISLPPAPDLYYVTGLQTIIQIIEGDARIVGYDNSDAVFPDIIRETVSQDGQSVELALGIGTGGNSIRIGNVPFGAVQVEAKVGSEPICVAVNRLQTDIAAEGIDRDVFDLNYLGGYESQVCVKVGPPAVPGDANGDGRVDIFDYNLVVSNFGLTDYGPVPGDVNRDGRVDIFDYNLVVSNFGTK